MKVWQEFLFSAVVSNVWFWIGLYWGRDFLTWMERIVS